LLADTPVPSRPKGQVWAICALGDKSVSIIDLFFLGFGREVGTAGAIVPAVRLPFRGVGKVFGRQPAHERRGKEGVSSWDDE